MTIKSLSENILKDKVLKRCTKCNVEKSFVEFSKNKNTPTGYASWCKQCANKNYIDNRAKRLSKNKEHHDNNKERCSKYDKERYLKNREIFLDYRRRRYKKHKDEILSKGRIYYFKNSEDILAKQKINRNPEKLSKYQKVYRGTQRGKQVRTQSDMKRRALKHGAEYENFDTKEIFERNNYRCQICNVKTRPDIINQYHSLYPNLDHIIPLSKGGAHTKLNTQCLCHQCNMGKSNKYVENQELMFG